MKDIKSIALFGLLFFAVATNAQPVITSSTSLPPLGYTDTVSVVSTTNFGAAGANVTWNFGSLAAVPNDILHVVTPVSTPYSSSFPTATYALKYTSFSGNTLFYEYSQVNSNAWEILGGGIGSSTSANYSADPRIRFPLPFSYLDTRTDVVQQTGAATYTQTITYDGYGTLIVPGATYNDVVRLKYDNGSTNIGYRWFTSSPLMLVAFWSNETGKIQFLGKYVLTGQPCNDKYEPNETSNSAKAIEQQNNHTAKISTSTDVDWYSFSTTNAKPNIKVTLTNLPQNYTLTLYKNNSQVGISQNAGTAAETIIRNTNSPGNYKIKVNGATATEYNAASCYTLNMDNSATAYSTSSSPRMYLNTVEPNESISLYPNPAKDAVTLRYVAIEAGPATISVMDLMGRTISSRTIDMQQGINDINLPLDNYKAGIYFLNVSGGKSIQFEVTE
jgi:hypothetical protein